MKRVFDYSTLVVDLSQIVSVRKGFPRGTAYPHQSLYILFKNTDQFVEYLIPRDEIDKCYDDLIQEWKVLVD